MPMRDVVIPLEQEGTEARVLSWYAQVGSPVAENEPLVELETDKVTVEVPAPCTGSLREILLAAGSEASPGAVLARIEEGAAAPDTAPPPEQP
jgi:2-oxoglutarate dehydrogenase E2 component (dihydrolipoamide succinyltransferase)